MFQANRLEGLGAPVHVKRPDLDDIDPTLESCCQREIETNRKGNALMATLSKHDVVAARERQRRNLITPEDCRCCFDPNQDGGEYWALIQLKQQLRKVDEIENDEIEEIKKEDGEEEEDEFDYLLEDSELPEDEFRRAELEWNMLQTEIRRFHGYGSVRQMHPSRVLGVALRAPVCVLHLFDTDSPASASLDLYFERTLAPKTMGTLFLRSDGRSTLLLNPKHFSDIDPHHNLPALIALKNGAIIQQNLQFQGLIDDTGAVIGTAVETWLDRCSVLRATPPVDEDLCRIRPEEQALTDSMAPRFDCGVYGCYKTFPHEHVGLSSRLVSEEEVLGR
ncbi:hypothetical protein FisN_20Lh106 [Fistulifera solaris]|uniref:Phosducin thioredoxin-like domain-containing protein n=1 Tax=Fistulifera solaris TaxID=1519565 RepID=A0A1Z5JCW3_FISSO|nr:hypothetical protein FisN_20Lh106 [Fistulifera solaris]|eukprot:GAX11837.1 hypothetical protein FisN_20Lh106 [Fistulifera solaris]